MSALDRLEKLFVIPGSRIPRVTRATVDGGDMFALLVVVRALASWIDSECDNESAETDDHTVAAARGECAGDTHSEDCQVSTARDLLNIAYAAFKDLP